MTDPDARVMRGNNGGGDISHNVQIAVEDKTHLVVAVDVTSEPTDYKQFHNMASKAKEELKVEEITAIADKGYYSADEFAKCKDSGITAIVSKADKNVHATLNYGKQNLVYNAEKDVYICPQGHEMKKYNHVRTTNKDVFRYANKKACLECPMKDLCTPHKHGRTVSRKKNDHYADEVDKRTKEFMDIYKKRQRMAEHPFGTIKRGSGFTYFLTRGTDSLRTETLMHFLIYNIKRVINTMGVEKLIGELQGCNPLFLLCYRGNAEKSRFQTRNHMRFIGVFTRTLPYFKSLHFFSKK